MSLVSDSNTATEPSPIAITYLELRLVAGHDLPTLCLLPLFDVLVAAMAKGSAVRLADDDHCEVDSLPAWYYWLGFLVLGPVVGLSLELSSRRGDGQSGQWSFGKA